MKKMRVTLDFTMSIPDEWRLVDIEEQEIGCVEIDGTRYDPGLMWMKVTDTGDGRFESVQVDDDTQLMFMEHVTTCSEEIKLIEDQS